MPVRHTLTRPAVKDLRRSQNRNKRHLPKTETLRYRRTRGNGNRQGASDKQSLTLLKNTNCPCKQTPVEYTESRERAIEKQSVQSM